MIVHSVVVWILTGLVAGWATRIVMRSHRDYALLGDLTTGCLGAVVGGWLLRRLNIWAPADLVGDVSVALMGAAALLTSVRVVRRVGAAVGGVIPSTFAPGLGDLDAQLQRATELERGLFAKFIRRRHAARDVNQAFEAQLTIGERVADRVAAFGGSWVFIGMFLAGMISWMAVNEDLANPFDPFPFILLNLVLSCLAAVQAPVIMMSQNRQAAKDRLDARNDFEVNLRAEMEIMALHEKLDAVRSKELRAVMQMLEDQRQRLTSIEQTLAAGQTTADCRP